MEGIACGVRKVQRTKSRRHLGQMEQTCSTFGGILDKGSTGLDRWRASHGVVDTLKYRHCAARHEVGEVGTGRRECITPRLKSRASRTWSVGP